MRTNIDIDHSLMNEAFKYTGATTKKQLVAIALGEFVLHHRRKNMADLKGKIKFSADYDHKKLRNTDA